MAFVNSNDFLTGRRPARFPSGAEIVCQRASVDLTTGDLVSNNFGAVGLLPAGCVMTGLKVDADDLDSGTGTLTLDVGILNAAGTGFDVTFATGLTVGASAGVVEVLSANMLRMSANSTTDRKIGVRINAAPNVAQAGTLFLHSEYRAV
ncbi:MAG TPA: hypothetical protein VFV57_05955 [Limnobacter sp.]|nr:hypothetical protein [Limnobacter sp.]